MLQAVERRRMAEDDRRRQLWRDSATILIGVIVALLVGLQVAGIVLETALSRLIL